MLNETERVALHLRYRDASKAFEAASATKNGFAATLEKLAKLVREQPERILFAAPYDAITQQKALIVLDDPVVQAHLDMKQLMHSIQKFLQTRQTFEALRGEMSRNGEDPIPERKGPSF